MAERSVQLNGLEEQMQVICDDLKNMPAHIQGSKGGYDFVQSALF